MVSAFCKMRENKRLRLVGGGSRSHEKPGPQIVLRTHPKKNCGIIAYYGIKYGFWQKTRRHPPHYTHYSD